MTLVVAIVCEILGVVTVIRLFLYNATVPYLFFLPLVYMACIPFLIKSAAKSKYSLFYILYLSTVFLRYVVHPLLISITGDYSEPSLYISLNSETMNRAALLMVYELIVCTIVTRIINKTSIKRENRKALSISSIVSNKSIYLQPNKTYIYKALILFTSCLVIMFPRSLRFFSFAFFSFGDVATDSLTLLEQVTVILIISSKYFIQILLMLKIHEKEQIRNKNYANFAFVVSCLLGCIYYGTNRMVFIFTFISSIFLYRIIFGKINPFIFFIAFLAGIVVLLRLTSARNYFNYFERLSGLDYYVNSIKMTINAYLGGITNVGVAIETKKIYGEYASFITFITDLLRPVVGLNKLLPNREVTLSNSYFNYAFFGNKEIVSQIMPSIGHGYYYFGFIFAPIGDIFILIVFALIERFRSQTMRIELIFLFMMISMRLAMMFGVNLIIINNELSMQLLFPLIVYWLNNRITLHSSISNKEALI